jgi:hypothetical protein
MTLRSWLLDSYCSEDAPYGTNSLVNNAPPKLGSVAVIFTTLCESEQSACQNQTNRRT